MLYRQALAPRNEQGLDEGPTGAWPVDPYPEALSSTPTFELVGGRGSKGEPKYKGKAREQLEAELKAAEQSGHKKKRPSTLAEHQGADARRRRDKGFEKGDKRRHYGFPTPTGAAWDLYNEWLRQQTARAWLQRRPGETQAQYDARTRFI